MRYDYFVREREWVSGAHDGFENDVYDGRALHLGVWWGGELAAYLRALPHDSGARFMLDSEFAPILSEATRGGLERNGTVELSRFVVSPLLRDKRNNWPIHPVEHLLKALYHLAQEQDYNRFYIVVEAGWPQVFARRFGLPFRVIGDPYTFADGTRTVAATATLMELEAGMRRHSLAKYEWYQKTSDISVVDNE